jgi:hypothetical protein
MAKKCAQTYIWKVAVKNLVNVFGKFDTTESSRSPDSSNRQTSTLVAVAENSAKFVPFTSQ